MNEYLLDTDIVSILFRTELPPQPLMERLTATPPENILRRLDRLKFTNFNRQKQTLIFDPGDFYITPIKGFHADSVAIEKSHTNQGMTPKLQDAHGSFDAFPENASRKATRNHNTFIGEAIVNGSQSLALRESECGDEGFSTNHQAQESTLPYDGLLKPHNSNA